ncbi:MAG: tRNA (adenosine(37)-N6)-threonylcarbamoyltransferase complex ATPase subunit type 1 TsaE [Candidatus Uhrbacteria bacterium]|nr:tRNA (adenosine(37)-N6)-threonylcarbamoyltransferase complex ATPase subunit type 1 TsaE [Candidatus Uhrbacteria bacterium]
MKTTTHSAEETQGVAAELAARVHGGEFIALIGDLGAGKTTFTQGFVAALGSKARVKSPTFTVMNEYVVDGHPTVHRVVHIDFYRFTTEREIRALELEAYRRPDVVIIAEWPNALPGVDWRPTYTVTFTQESADVRTIEVS